MKLWEKLKSRKLWVAGAGMATGVATDNPLLSVILGAVYVIIEGIIDIVRSGEPEK
jgi:hypothetical protein